MVVSPPQDSQPDQLVPNGCSNPISTNTTVDTIHEQCQPSFNSVQKVLIPSFIDQASILGAPPSIVPHSILKQTIEDRAPLAPTSMIL